MDEGEHERQSTKDTAISGTLNTAEMGRNYIIVPVNLSELGLASCIASNNEQRPSILDHEQKALPRMG